MRLRSNCDQYWTSRGTARSGINSCSNWRTAKGVCGSDGPCVLVGDGPDGWKAIRDTKKGDESETLFFDAAEWRVFLDGARAGDFD
jgi:Domain of unknown function (DUF397)